MKVLVKPKEEILKLRTANGSVDGISMPMTLIETIAGQTVNVDDQCGLYFRASEQNNDPLLNFWGSCIIPWSLVELLPDEYKEKTFSFDDFMFGPQSGGTT